MARTRTWTVEIHITEHGDDRHTYADAVLRGVRPILRGEGEAHLPPSDQETPETDDEPATARALADLAYKALDIADDDIGRFAHRPMRMLS